MRIAKTRIKALERREQSILSELDDKRTLCERLQAERDNLLLDCESYQGRIDKADERYNKALALVEGIAARNTGEGTLFEYSGLDCHFKETISLEESKRSVMEAASLLAMLPHTEEVDARAAYCHTIAQCIYEYTDLLNRIGGKEL